MIRCTESFYRPVLCIPAVCVASGGDLREVKEDLGLDNGTVKQLCCNELHWTFLVRKSGQKSHPKSMPANDTMQAEGEVSPCALVSKCLRFSSDSSEERLDTGAHIHQLDALPTTPAGILRSTPVSSRKKSGMRPLGIPIDLRNPAKGSTATKATTRPTKKTLVGQRGDFVRTGSLLDPFNIGSSSDSTSASRVQRRREKAPAATVDNALN